MTIGNAITKVIALSPVQWLFFFINRKRLRVLTYHETKDTPNLEKQIIYIKNKYNVINARDLENHLFHRAPLPSKPVLLTLDDGEISIFQKGLPLCKKHGISFTVFIITGLIDSDKPFWWDEVKYHLGPQKKEREKVLAVNALKKLKNKERLDKISELKAQSPLGPLKRPQLSKSDLTEMERQGFFIANHTHTHPMLDQCTEEEIAGELANSDQFMKAMNLSGRSYFAYPNGNSSGPAEKIIRDHNIKLAFLFDHQINPAEINPWRISRLSINSDTSLEKMKIILSGLHSFLLNLKKYINSSRQ